MINWTLEWWRGGTGSAFTSGTCFIAAPSEDADGCYRNLLSQGWPPDTSQRFYGSPLRGHRSWITTKQENVSDVAYIYIAGREITCHCYDPEDIFKDLKVCAHCIRQSSFMALKSKLLKSIFQFQQWSNRWHKLTNAVVFGPTVQVLRLLSL